MLLTSLKTMLKSTNSRSTEPGMSLSFDLAEEPPPVPTTSSPTRPLLMSPSGYTVEPYIQAWEMQGSAVW